MKRTIKSDYFYIYFGLLGGLWAVLNRVAAVSLRKYIGFQINKNAVKNLYRYSRTKTENKDDSITLKNTV